MRKTTSFPLALLIAATLAACGTAVARTEAASAPTAIAAANHAAQNAAQNAAQIHRAEIAPALYELAYSEKQQAVFVAAPAWGANSKNEASKLLRLDPRTLAVQTEIMLPHPGFSVALDEAANRLYVGHSGTGFISVIDTAENRIIKTLPLAPGAGKPRDEGGFSYGVRTMRLDASGQRLYVPGMGPDSVLFIVDTARLETIKTVEGLGSSAAGAMAVTVDDTHGRIFVGISLQGIKVVDAKRLAVTDTWELDTGGFFSLHHDAQSNRLFGAAEGLLERYLPETRKAFPDLPLRPSVARTLVVDAATRKELANMPTTDLPKRPLALQLDAQRKRLYVANRGDDGPPHPEETHGTVSVYDSESYRLLQTIPLPPNPNSLAFDAKNNVLYVSVKNDRSSSKAGKLESVVRIQF